MTNVPSAPREFLQKRQLGVGAFSRVWLAQHIALRKEVAIKIITKADVRTDKMKERLDREIENHKKMNHPYIAPLFSVTENILHYFLVMEYVPGGSLLDRISEAGRLTEREARHYFRQILSALTYLHQQLHIAHRDLKCDNVMIDEHNNVRLIDFGFSKSFDNDLLRTNCGSPRYAAPEMFRSGPYTEACDVWSLGVILYVSVCGKFPFDSLNMQDLGHVVLTAEPEYPDHLSHNVSDLLRGMLRKSPSARLTIDKITAHPWVGSRVPLAGSSGALVRSSETLETKLARRDKSRVAGMLPKTLPVEKSPETKSSVSIVERLCATGKFRPAKKRNDEMAKTGAVQITPAVRGVRRLAHDL